MCRKRRAFGLWDGCWSLCYSHKLGLHLFPPCLNIFLSGIWLLTTARDAHHGAWAVCFCLALKIYPLSACVGGSYMELNGKC